GDPGGCEDHVDVEAPAPGQVLGEHAAEQQPDSAARADDPSVGAERGAALLLPGNVVVSSDSPAGASRPPNPPWHTRATTSIPKPVAAPPTAEAAANPIRPARNVCLRPSRSASLPPSSSRLPNASA